MMAAKQLSILQMNDTHAYLEAHPELFWKEGKAFYQIAGGFARIAFIVDQARKEAQGRILFLDNGDTMHGTYPAKQTRGEVMVPILNEMGLDAMTAHWEFAEGPEQFLSLAGKLNYPVLAANIDDKQTSKGIFPAYKIFEQGSLTIGIIGLASNIVDKTMPPSFSEGLSFHLGKDRLPRIIDLLRNQEKVDIVILLSHLGLPQDLQLTKDVPGVDICLSGHTHNRLYHPIQQDGTIVIQSGSQGSFVGRLDIEFDSRKVILARHHLIVVDDSIPSQPTIEELVRSAVSPFQQELAGVVGETAIPLHRNTSLDSPMDNLLLQALLHSAPEAQVAFSNGWRYGAPVLPGPVTVNDLFNIIPTNPPVSLVDLNGEEILDMLENNIEHTYSHNPYEQMGGYLKRAAGIRVLFKVENPFPHRIQKIFIGEEELVRDRVYTTTFVTQQGVPEEYGHSRRNLPIRAVDALRKYLSSQKEYTGGEPPAFTLV